MNFLKTIESSLKKYKVFSEDLKVYRITLLVKKFQKMIIKKLYKIITKKRGKQTDQL